MFTLKRVGRRRDISALIMIGLALLIVVTSGCGRSSGPGNSGPSPASVAKKFKVALIMSGPVTDNGWNAGAYQGWKDIRSDLHLSAADSPYVENVTAAGDQEKNLREFASQGVAVVFAHGSEYEGPALRIEKDYPNTLFIVSSGSRSGHNTMPIIFRLEDGAFLLGMLAAGMSKTGIIASVGAEQSPPLQSIFSAYAKGAKAVNPAVRVLNPVYTGNWEDVGKAKQAALSLIDQGADVLIQDLDAGAQGVFNAAQERNKPGKPVFALGTNSDQNSAAPRVVLASAPIDVPKVMLVLARQARMGKLQPNDVPFGMADGIITFVYNPKLVPIIPKDLQRKIEVARAAIIRDRALPKQVE